MVSTDCVTVSGLNPYRDGRYDEISSDRYKNAVGSTVKTTFNTNTGCQLRVDYESGKL